MLPSTVLLNPRFTEAEVFEPHRKKSLLSENAELLAEEEEQLRHCVWGKNKASSTECKGRNWAQFRRAVLINLMKTKRKNYQESLIVGTPISLFFKSISFFFFN